jgi:hypothetical protein
MFFLSPGEEDEKRGTPPNSGLKRAPKSTVEISALDPGARRWRRSSRCASRRSPGSEHEARGPMLVVSLLVSLLVCGNDDLTAPNRHDG